MSDKRFGKWFTSKKGNRCRYYYKDGLKIGIQIAGIGYHNLSTKKFYPDKSSEKRIKTREIQRARRLYNAKKLRKYWNYGYLDGYNDSQKGYGFGK